MTAGLLLDRTTIESIPFLRGDRSVSMSDQLDAFTVRLLSGLERCQFVHGSVLVGVSGGADSVALLRGLIHLRNHCRTTSQRNRGPERHLEIVAAHVNHQLRDDSDDDAEWVRALTEELEVKCRIESADVTRRVAETGESLEEAARSARYRVLTTIAKEEACSAIAVAHTADDQAETVLHHLVRGTSVTGLRGMRWTRPVATGNGSAGGPGSAAGSDSCDARLIRPMLDIRRKELEAWLHQIGQRFRTDSTNTDETLTRNRIRHRLLPLLEHDFNPQIRKALGTLAGHASEVSDLLRQLAQQQAESALVQISDTSIRIDCLAFAEQPTILIRETLLTIWQQARWPLKRMGHREWQALADLVSEHRGAVSLPEKIDARRRGQMLVLSRATGQAEGP